MSCLNLYVKRFAGFPKIWVHFEDLRSERV